MSNARNGNYLKVRCSSPCGSGARRPPSIDVADVLLDDAGNFSAPLRHRRESGNRRSAVASATVSHRPLRVWVLGQKVGRFVHLPQAALKVGAPALEAFPFGVDLAALAVDPARLGLDGSQLQNRPVPLGGAHPLHSHAN